MCVQTDLLQLGVPSYMMSIYITLPTSQQQSFEIAKQMPTQIGWIYGISTYVDGFTPENKPLISNSNAESLYLLFKDGGTEFAASKRLSELVFQTPVVERDMWYCNIPGNIDLSQSKIQNPQLLVGTGAGECIMLNLYYIDWTSYFNLIAAKYLKPIREMKNPNR